MQPSRKAKGDLPVALTPFIGRTTEADDILRLLRTTRLLTLTGAGGSGKTRMALEVARRVDYRPVRWVELVSLVEASLIAEHVGTQLGVPERLDRAPLECLTDALQTESPLLVLDNCEHIIDAAAAFVAGLLERCEQLTVLVTSREALGIDGERAWLVRGLATDTTDALQPCDAARLFVDRAQAASTSFSYNGENAGAIAQICRRLDGLPLALELAAARTAVLTPEQIAARLDGVFELLTTGSRVALPRHRTLAAAVEWSYRLLSAQEQRLLTCLSVFSGSFSLDAAEHIGAGDDLPAEEVLDLLAALVRRSLVTMNDESGEARYSLLEIIRQFARRTLRERPTDRDALDARHADFYAALAEAALPVLERTHSGEWVDRLTLDYSNFRAALHWAFAGGARETGQRLFANLWWYWGQAWLPSEWRFWLEEALHTPAPQDSQTWGQLLNGAGTFYYMLGDLVRGEELLEESARVLGAAGDRIHESMARNTLCHLLCADDRIDEARIQGEAATEIARQLDVAWPLCHGMANALGRVLVRLGEFDAADAGLSEAFEKAQLSGGHAWGMAEVARARAAIALDRGQPAAAGAHLLTSLRLLATLRDPHTVFRALCLAERLLCMLGRNDEAARMHGGLGAAIAAGMLVFDDEAQEHGQVAKILRQRLGEAAFDAATEGGRTLSLAQTLDICATALASLESPCVIVETPLRTGSSRRLDVRALGGISLNLNGSPTGRALPRSRAAELLVYLLVHRDGRTREQIGVEFWPDASAAQVKNNFHVLLHKLRRHLGSNDFIVNEDERYRVSQSLDIWFDAVEFEHEVARALRDPGARRDATRLNSALALYRGDFLDGSRAGEWAFEHQERLRRLYTDGLSALADMQIAGGDFTAAGETLERLLRHDDLHEDACRRLMACLEKTGRRDHGLRLYRALQARLRDELAADPEPATQALAKRLTGTAEV